MEKKYLYVVNQTQPYENYEQTTIAVFTDEADALKLARALNKEYGDTDVCEFDDDWDFVEIKDDGDTEYAHYYEVDSVELDPDINIYS